MDFMIPRVNFYMIFMGFYNPSMDFIRFLGILEFLAGGCYKLSHIKRFYLYRSSNVEARTRNGWKLSNLIGREQIELQSFCF